MKTQNITIKCGRCNGAGSDDNKRDAEGNIIPESCISCGGDGYIESALIDVTEVMDSLDWLKKKIKKILKKLEIEEED